jgi:hypothetical protein
MDSKEWKRLAYARRRCAWLMHGWCMTCWRAAAAAAAMASSNSRCIRLLKLWPRHAAWMRVAAAAAADTVQLLPDDDDDRQPVVAPQRWCDVDVMWEPAIAPPPPPPRACEEGLGPGAWGCGSTISHANVGPGGSSCCCCCCCCCLGTVVLVARPWKLRQCACNITAATSRSSPRTRSISSEHSASPYSCTPKGWRGGGGGCATTSRNGAKTGATIPWREQTLHREASVEGSASGR